jgi:hypothetical protein
MIGAFGTGKPTVNATSSGGFVYITQSDWRVVGLNLTGNSAYTTNRGISFYGSNELALDNEVTKFYWNLEGNSNNIDDATPSVPTFVGQVFADNHAICALVWIDQDGCDSRQQF